MITQISLYMEDFKEMLREAISVAIEDAKQQEPRFYSRQEVCKLLNISQPTLCNMISRGDIILLKIGGRALFCADAIDAALKTTSLSEMKGGVHDE